MSDYLTPSNLYDDLFLQKVSSASKDSLDTLSKAIEALSPADEKRLREQYEFNIQKHGLEALCGSVISESHTGNIKLLYKVSGDINAAREELRSDLDPSRRTILTKKVERLDVLLSKVTREIFEATSSTSLILNPNFTDAELAEFLKPISTKEIKKVERKAVKLNEAICAYPPCSKKDSFKQALKKCERCKKFMDIRYCSKECQTNDWKAGHKGICGKDPALTTPSSASVPVPEELD